VKRRRQARVPPKRTADQQTARQRRQILKDSIANAKKQLLVAQDELGELDAFVFVCITALRAKGGDDDVANVATVLDVTYGKLALDVNQHIREALEALNQDGDQ
jgi:hypothetical protein